MNISEMHVWFRQYAQQMGMQNVRAILPEQIDLLINTSINDVVNNIINENISNRNDRVITDNSKIGQINSLRTLYTTVDVEAGTEVPHVKGNEIELDKLTNKPYVLLLSQLDEFLYLDDFAISYNIKNEGNEQYTETKLFPIRIIDRAYLADTLQDYILSPRFRTPIAAVTNRTVTKQIEVLDPPGSKPPSHTVETTDVEEVLDIYVGENELHSNLLKNMSINKIECSVIKKPAKVKYVSDINGENVDCDLPETLHYDILKHAVDLYRISIAGSIGAAQEQAQNQARENIRNNIREE